MHMGLAGLRLAYAAYRAGAVDDAAELAVLAFGSPDFNDVLDNHDEARREVDDDAAAKPMVEMLKDGEPGGAMDARTGEAPIAFVQDVARAVRHLERAGHRDLADDLAAAFTRVGLDARAQPTTTTAKLWDEEPETCQECGSWSEMELENVDISGREAKGWRCDECGYVHEAKPGVEASRVETETTVEAAPTVIKPDIHQKMIPQAETAMRAWGLDTKTMPDKVQVVARALYNAYNNGERQTQIAAFNYAKVALKKLRAEMAGALDGVSSFSAVENTLEGYWGAGAAAAATDQAIVHINAESAKQPETTTTSEDAQAAARRWAVLVARHVAAGRLEQAAAIVVLMSRSKQFVPGDPDTQVDKHLHEMLDKTGYDSLMKVTDKRRKALEREPHNMTLLYPMPAG